MEGSLVAYKVFTNGSVLNASEINDNLMNQAVMVFSNSAARTAAITSPVEGMMTWLEDVNRYESYNGTSWVNLISPGSWVSYTPTFTNITVGNGTMSAKYAIIGKTMHLSFFLQLGTTSSIGTQPKVGLPSGITSVANNFNPVGKGFATTAGQAFNTTLLAFNSTTIYPVVDAANQTYSYVVDISATVPGTWGNGNTLQFIGTMEIA
jgi:hypothetical protein